MISKQEYEEIVNFVNDYLDGKEVSKNENLPRIISNAKILEEKLYSNVMMDNFDMYYQPKFENGIKTKSAEALFRSKDEFNVRPDVAFTLFKIFGHEKEVVLKQIDRITDDLVLFTNKIDKDYKVSINIALDCIDESLANNISCNIIRKKLSYDNLEIEILESENFNKIQNHIDVINFLHQKGIKFAIDDFGSRNANFDALTILPFDVIKIDSSYIKDAFAHQDYSKIEEVEREISLSYPDAEIVVEGLEEEQDFDALNDTRIPQTYQGYYFAKPMTAQELVEKYKNQSKETIKDSKKSDKERRNNSKGKKEKTSGSEELGGSDPGRE